MPPDRSLVEGGDPRLRTVRRAQAAVRARVPGWRGQVALLLLVQGCGGSDEASEAAARLVQEFPQRRRRRRRR